MFPTEILFFICKECTDKDLLNLRSVSSLVKNIIDSNYFWKKRLKEYYKEGDFLEYYKRSKQVLRIKEYTKRERFNSMFITGKEEALTLFKILSLHDETWYVIQFRKEYNSCQVSLYSYSTDYYPSLKIEICNKEVGEKTIRNFLLTYNYEPCT